MTSLVLHIPHSSRLIPADLRGEIRLDEAELARELLRMTDHFTDELIDPARLGAPAVIYRVSRLVVDPERFPDDAQEPMAERGMGAIYTRTSDGRVLRESPTVEARRARLDRFYVPHHLALTRAVDAALERRGRCLVVDCHSFPAHALPYESDQRSGRPEICLGTDASHTPPALASVALEAFREAGFDAAQNRPFAGALVPMKHYRRDVRVNALMIEVRRDLYMNEATAERLPSFDAFRGRLCAIVDSVHERWREG